MGEEGHKGHEKAHSGSGREKGFKYSLFIALVVLLAIAVFLVLRNIGQIAGNFIWVGLALLVILFVARYDVLLLLKEYERAVIYRFGRVNRVGGPGWTLAFPPLEDYDVVDLRTKTIDTPKQEVVTKDNIEVVVDAAVYLRVSKDAQSVINSVVEVDDYLKASKLFVQALIRDKAASLTLSELISRVDNLNDIIKKELERVSSKWGVVVEEAVIQDIEIPDSVLQSMHDYRVAIQKKLARIERAEGHRAEIEAVRSAAEQLNDRALAYYYVKALEKLGEGKSTKVIFPMELTNLAKSLSGEKGASQNEIESLLRKYAPLVKSLADGKQPEKKKK